MVVLVMVVVAPSRFPTPIRRYLAPPVSILAPPFLRRQAPPLSFPALFTRILAPFPNIPAPTLQFPVPTTTSTREIPCHKYHQLRHR